MAGGIYIINLSRMRILATLVLQTLTGVDDADAADSRLGRGDGADQRLDHSGIYFVATFFHDLVCDKKCRYFVSNLEKISSKKNTLY